jgi:hypothetical protein
VGRQCALLSLGTHTQGREGGRAGNFHHPLAQQLLLVCGAICRTQYLGHGLWDAYCPGTIGKSGPGTKRGGEWRSSTIRDRGSPARLAWPARGATWAGEVSETKGDVTAPHTPTEQHGKGHNVHTRPAMAMPRPGPARIACTTFPIMDPGKRPAAWLTLQS